MRKKKRLYAFIPAFLYGRFEKYLEEMSLRGWRLAAYTSFRFDFEEEPLLERKYFLWHSGGYRRTDGRYDLNLRYHDIAAQFGLPRKRSPLNAFTKKQPSYLSIIELEPEKQYTEAFEELLADRKRLYFRETLRNCLFVTLIGIGLLFLARSGAGSLLGWCLISAAILWALAATVFRFL